MRSWGRGARQVQSRSARGVEGAGGDPCVRPWSGVLGLREATGGLGEAGTGPGRSYCGLCLPSTLGLGATPSASLLLFPPSLCDILSLPRRPWFSDMGPATGLHRGLRAAWLAPRPPHVQLTRASGVSPEKLCCLLSLPGSGLQIFFSVAGAGEAVRGDAWVKKRVSLPQAVA